VQAFARVARWDTAAASPPWYRSLGRTQWNTLIASNLGWVFDGYETYALVISVGVALRQTRGKPLPE
jgi:hypothetical protein